MQQFHTFAKVANLHGKCFLNSIRVARSDKYEGTEVLKIGIRGWETVAAIEKIDGNRCAWVENNVVETVGIDRDVTGQ
ncbi:hypothetical protein TNCV_3538701 [Trichonephila clavipes]|nr:hypothetical protein TNCV_3538701 [Trichonephila clavipes]